MRAWLCAWVLLSLCGSARADTLPGHVPIAQIARSRLVGRVEAASNVETVLTLPLRDPDQLERLIARLHDPADPLYGQYLTPEQFAARFGPTEADYDAAVAYLASAGFRVAATHPNRTVLELEAPAETVERALSVHLVKYRRDDGREFFAPDADPEVPAALASRVRSFVGLHTANRRHPHARRLLANTSGVTTTAIRGLSPAQIRAAYEVPSNALGSGQVTGLMLLDGYDPTDLQTYAAHFGITLPEVVNIVGDGASTTPGGDQDEATLDVEMAVAMAPGVSKLMVYQAKNTDGAILAALNKIANDDTAKSISTSWGDYESDCDPKFLEAEAAVFQQMAAQGQTYFAAAGDDGAYDDGKTLSVDDPSSQPYVTGVGGTSLILKSDGSYDRESTWNAGSDGSRSARGSGGGGISAKWPIPSWQKPFITSAARASTTMRNVPDIALDADPHTGFAVFLAGTWQLYGGTSASSPLWAGFGSLINEARAARGRSAVGYLNPLLYAIAGGSRYAADFHDVADGTTNLFYPTVTGYDCATGLGTLRGAGLIADLADAASAAVAVPAGTPTAPPSSTGAAPAATTSTSPTSSKGGCRAGHGEAPPGDAAGHVLPLALLFCMLALRHLRKARLAMRPFDRHH